jgi:hypothetical protein
MRSRRSAQAVLHRWTLISSEIARATVVLERLPATAPGRYKPPLVKRLNASRTIPAIGACDSSTSRKTCGRSAWASGTACWATVPPTTRSRGTGSAPTPTTSRPSEPFEKGAAQGRQRAPDSSTSLRLSPGSWNEAQIERYSRSNLYDRRNDDISVGEVERIGIRRRRRQARRAGSSFCREFLLPDSTETLINRVVKKSALDK